MRKYSQQMNSSAQMCELSFDGIKRGKYLMVLGCGNPIK